MAEEKPLKQKSSPKVVEMQHVIVTLADGRRGVFMGPALIKESEMKLNCVPRLVSVDFDPPRAVMPPEDKEEEPKNADPKEAPTPAADINVGKEVK